MELSCAVQCYAWGKVGQSSQVAKFAPRACQEFQLDESKTIGVSEDQNITERKITEILLCLN